MFLRKPDLIRDGLAFVVNHSNDGTIRANVSLVLPFAKRPRLIDYSKSDRVVGAVVLDPPR